MSELQRIDDMQSPPVIGQRYLVPCVRVAGPVGSRKPLRRGVGSDGCEGMLPGWWPVIGPEHEDAAILAFPHQHWHFDLRFLSKSQVRNRRIGVEEGHASSIARLLSFPLTNHGSLGTPEHRPRRCLREQPDWSAWMSVAGRSHRPEIMLKLERIALVKGQTLKACKVCPHRGLPLGSIPAVDGIVTCPGHGMRWDASTGQPVRTPGPIRAAAFGPGPCSDSIYGDNPNCVDILNAARRDERVREARDAG